MPDSDVQPLQPVIFVESGDFGVERVFPIRNLVGHDEGLHNQKEVESGNIRSVVEGLSTRKDIGKILQYGDNSDIGASITKHQASVAAKEPAYLPPPYPPIPPEATLRRLPPAPANNALSGLGDGDEKRKISERAQMVPGKDGPPGAILRVADDAKPTFYRCEDEPIHRPGAIQQYGTLIALKFNEEGNLQVRIASENSRQLLQYSPEQLFALKSFLDLLETDIRQDMISRITNAVSTADEEVEDTHLDVFQMAVTSPRGLRIPLWCAIHISQGTKDLVICEFEDHSDVFHLDPVQNINSLPKEPIHTLDNELLPEEFLKSTTSGSIPLRVLRAARLRQQKNVSSMDIFNAMTQAQQQLAGATSVQNVLDIVVGLISELTGFHRVMFYRFDPQKNGCIDAELVNPQASHDLFRGLHFPASDIPKQAQELYKINRIRILHDRDAETARLVCRDITDFEKPLDLTHAYLRAMSPIHLKYLGNMGVRSSMSVSIVINQDLWGLVACHGYGDHGIRVTLPIRELCRNIGECAATNIERLIMIHRIQARKPPLTAPPPQNPAGFIAASSSDLLRVFDADFGLLSIQDEARAIGRLDPYREALAILAHLQARRFTSVLASQNINEEFVGIKYLPGIKTIAGLLFIPLSIGGNDFLVFFRKGQLREVRWAGNPYEKLTRGGSQYLEPRSSFKRWTETVVGMSKEWTEDQMETASVLSILFGRFIEIWRQKESMSQNNRMTRLLLRNSGHELRTPLNAIVNYLEMALENKVDDSTREILAKAHKASKSLIYVIDDLLNLTKAEDGPVNSPAEIFDLGATVSEVITAFQKEAMRKGLDLTVSTHPGIPEMVKGDPSRLRQVLSNVTGNAFQNSVNGGIKVDIRPLSHKPNSSVIGITVQDLGFGMSENQLDDLFQEFEQITDDDNRLTSASNTPSTTEGGQSLGVGLAVVARYVRNMNGQIRVRSELGKGTIFGIELPFEHATALPIIPLNELSSNIKPPPQISLIGSGYINLPSSSGKAIQEPFESYSPMDEVLSASSQQPSNAESPQAPSGALRSLSNTDASPPSFLFPSVDDNRSGLQKESLAVLIAEDNPINARLLTRRLQKFGHEVEVAYDGQECHDYFTSKPHGVDVVLMDLQMPLVDGALSTRMIRNHEKQLDELRKIRPRVPVIAVSASLIEENRYDYIESGFDAWILKPIDFTRLEFMLQGVKTRYYRREALYMPGLWAKGGWFLP